MGSVRFGFAALVAAAFLLQGLSSPVRAGSEPPSPYATAYNTERKLARSSDGTLYAAVAVNVGGIPQVRVLATTDGATWTALPHPSPTNNASDRAALGIDSIRRLHLVWTENATGGARQVFYARFEGGAWTPAEQLSHSIGYAGFPSLAVDAQDRPHVVWYGFDGAFYQVYYRRLDSGSWTAERALTRENVDATSPAIALGPAGEVNVVWFRQNRNQTLDEIAYLRLVGDTLVENATISPPNVDAIDPSIVVDAAGDVHVVWSALVGGVDRIQHAIRPTNASWALAGIVSPPGIGARHASLALHRTGGSTPDDLRVVWEGTDGQIYVQAGPVAWSAPSPLTFGGVNLYPSARWAQDHNPLCPDAIGIDVIWTHEVGSVYSLGYASLASANQCVPGTPRLPSGVYDPLYMGIVVAAVAITAVLAFVAWRYRKGAPRQPGSP